MINELKTYIIMKNLLLVLFVLAAFGLQTNANTITEYKIGNSMQYINKQPAFEEVGPTIVIKIEIGRLSRGCKGFGICNVKFGLERGAGNATGHINEDGELVLEIDVSKFSSQEVKEYLNGKLFTMGESLKLPKKLCYNLGVDSYTITKGKYKILKKGKTHTIVFN